MLFARPAAAEGSAASCTRISDEGLLSEGYLSAYRYKTAAEGEGVYISEYSANGGNYGGTNGNTADKAFDGNFSTFWETGRANSADFINHFTVTFSGSAQVGRIIYATRQDAYAGRGYPTLLTVYISDAESGEDFEKICEIASSNGGSKVLFDLGKVYECRRIRLEFTDISSDLKFASASELIFLKPEESAVTQIRSAFSDYTCHTFTEDFVQHAEERIAAAKKTAAYLYSDEVKILTDRAEQVQKGEVSFDPAFELSTADGAENPIIRAGDTAGYARNTLKMVWMGTNRQVTGIGAEAGTTLTVFVDCKEGDPLPSIECTQFLGTWQGWRSGPISLSKGINFITVPNYYRDWSNTVPGGPLYIVNPYTQSQQSDRVKVYIEGGYSFPVYRTGESEGEYLADLENYLASVGQEADRLPDMTEITGDNVILTVTASQAHTQYAAGGYSPAGALANWKEYLSALYDFCGVYDEGHSDPRAQYLNVNIRVMQPLAGAAAYAYGEHIGIYPNGDWEVTCLRAENFGWGVTHELGHMMDISERTWGEYTNNMWSQFNKCALSGEDARGNFGAFLSAAVKDGVPYEERDAYSDHTDAAITWWVIESRYPGFWGRFENNYRYADRAGITDAAELHVYFASLAAGTDLSYYFERIGFNWKGDHPFKGYESASEPFKAAIDKAISSGKIKTDALKLWYLDAKAYRYTVNYGKDLSLYSGTEQIGCTLGKTSSGVMLLMDGVSDFRHLGYEILRGNGSKGYQVIGFTYGRSFTDTSPAEGETYKVRAYDRSLGCSALSSAEEILGAVARADGQDYQTLAEAFAAVPAGGTVYLLADAFAAGIAIDKDVTLTALSSDVKVYLSAPSAMFTVQSGASLTIEGDAHALTFDGLEVSKNEALFVSNGTLSIRGNVILENSVNGSANGGAIRVQSGRLLLGGGVIVRNNRSSNGGAVVSQAGANATFQIDDAVFSGNAASGNGGAIYANCVVNLSGAVFENNAAANGGAVCINGGGILTVSGCAFCGNTASSQGGALRLDGKTSFADERTSFTGNKADRGGAIYAANANNARRAVISSAEFTENTAKEGGAVYIAGFAALGAEGTYLVISGGGETESSALYVAQNADLAEGAGALSLRGGVVLYAPLPFGNLFSDEESSFEAVFTLSGGEQRIIARFSSDIENLRQRSFAVIQGKVYVAETEQDGDVSALTVSQTGACTVTVSDGGASSTAYYIPGESFVLPQAETPQGYIFKGWAYGGRLYAAGETVSVSSDMSFTAEYEKMQEGGNGPSGDLENEGDGGKGGGLPVWVYAVIGVAVAGIAAVIAADVYIRSRRKKK